MLAVVVAEAFKLVLLLAALAVVAMEQTPRLQETALLTLALAVVAKVMTLLTAAQAVQAL